MAVTENFGEGGRRVVLEVLPGLHDAVFISVGEDGVAGLYNLHPLGLGPQNDAGLFEEIGWSFSFYFVVLVSKICLSMNSAA